MLHESIRPLSEAERDQLRSFLARPPVPGVAAVYRANVGCFTVLAVLGGIVAVLFRYWDRSVVLLGLLGITLFVSLLALNLAVSFVRSDLQRRRQELRYRQDGPAEIEAALRDGRAMVSVVECESVAGLIIGDSMTPVYAFDLGDGRTLVLDTCRWPERELREWPSTCVETVSTLEGGLVLHLRSTGTHLQPCALITIHGDPPELDWVQELEPLLDQSLESLIQAARASAWGDVRPYPEWSEGLRGGLMGPRRIRTLTGTTKA